MAMSMAGSRKPAGTTVICRPWGASRLCGKTRDDTFFYMPFMGNIVTVSADAGQKLEFDGPPLWFFKGGSEPNRVRYIPLQNADAVVIISCDFGSFNVFRK
jgi:hypothetical protein